jgi:hypothetical protein
MSIESYQEEIAAETQKVQEAMSKCKTGIKVMESSMKMAQSIEMNNLMQSISNPEVPENIQNTIGQYMGQMLQANSRKGLENFAKYLEKIALDDNYKSLKNYLLKIKDASLALNKSEVFKNYTILYENFQKDKSIEAENAKKSMQIMAEKAQKWSKENNNTKISNSSSTEENSGERRE